MWKQSYFACVYPWKTSAPDSVLSLLQKAFDSVGRRHFRLVEHPGTQLELRCFNCVHDIPEAGSIPTGTNLGWVQLTEIPLCSLVHRSS